MVKIAWCEWFPVPEALCRQPNELTFSLKYMSVQEALRQLKPKPGAKAAVELLKPMCSGALPTAIQCARVRDGQTLSGVVVQYPMPAYWNAMSPEILGKDGAWTIPDGDAFVMCYAQVDIQCFNELFLSKAKPARGAGGVAPTHDWGGAVRHVEQHIKDTGKPLARKTDAEPNIAAAVRLMLEYFKERGKNRTVPRERTVFQWISDHPQKWWGPD